MDTTRKPSWLRAKLPSGPGYLATRKLVDKNKLHTVCQSAQCPNLGECWSRGTATVMILGNICTRSCNFCAIQTGRPTELDLGEPARVADAVAKMGLRHCVITSVARDELADGGAAVWAAIEIAKPPPGMDRAKAYTVMGHDSRLGQVVNSARTASIISEPIA